MKYLLVSIFVILSSVAQAVDDTYVRGSTSKLLLVNMYDTAGLAKTGLAYSSMTITYTRNNAAADTDITEATMTMGTWASGGWIEVDATNSPGLYQFGIPDAAIATGAESVMFSFKATSTFQRVLHVTLIDVDFRNGANVAANTVLIEGTDATTQLDTAVSPVLTDTNAVDTASELQTLIFGSATPGATASALATAQSDITSILADTSAFDTASEIQTLLYGSATAGATAAALATLQSDATNILADTSAVDSSTEIRTLLTGSDSAIAKESTQGGSAADIRTEIEAGYVGQILTDTAAMDTAAELQALLYGSATPGATAAALSTAQSDITDILADTSAADTSNELRTLLTGGTNALATTSDLHLTIFDDILADTAALDTATELRTLLTGSDTPLSMESTLSNLLSAGKFTADALSNAPSGGGGGGGSATVENQELILADLAAIKGAGFDTNYNSLAALFGAGTGSVPVNEDTGGDDTYKVVDPGTGSGIGGVQVIAYVKSDYLAGVFTQRGQVLTRDDGTWGANLMLNPGVVYTLVFYKPGVFGPNTAEVDP